MPTNDSGLTARDTIETGDREADLALQADKLAVRELIAKIEREQLETLQRILDAQTSFGGQGLPAMVSGLESGNGDPDRSAEAVYGTAEIDPNPGGAQMFGDASETIEQLIIRVAQETSGFAGVGPRRSLTRPMARAAASADLAGKPVYDRCTVSRRRLWSHPDHAGHRQRSGHQPGIL